jgi:hypothetical protein
MGYFQHNKNETKCYLSLAHFSHPWNNIFWTKGVRNFARYVRIHHNLIKFMSFYGDIEATVIFFSGFSAVTPLLVSCILSA